MALAPFRIATAQPVEVQVALEPVYNTLMSMSLLHIANRVADLDPWLVQTAADMTTEQLHTNRLVFEGLGEALVMEDRPPSFDEYLTTLAEYSPSTLRDQVLTRLMHQEITTQTAEPAPDATQLLADADLFVRHVARVYAADSIDEQLGREVHVLLNDPPSLQRTVVEHLRTLWTTKFQQNWQRNRGVLECLIEFLDKRTWPADTAAAAITAFLNRDLPASIAPQLEGVQRVVFVLSPHAGPLASRFDSATTIWVFVRGRVEDLPMRTVPIKRVEVLGPLTALADDTRLRILELLARKDNLRAQEIIEQVALSQSNTSRHLKQLVGAGFIVEQKDEGANKSYRLNPARIAWLGRALVEVLSARPEPQPDTRTDQPADIRRFLDASGRVATWPARPRDMSLILHYLASKFERGRIYSEREVNTVLSEWDTALDPSTLRRELYDAKLLDRTRDGARYWREAEDE